MEYVVDDKNFSPYAYWYYTNKPALWSTEYFINESLYKKISLIDDNKICIDYYFRCGEEMSLYHVFEMNRYKHKFQCSCFDFTVNSTFEEIKKILKTIDNLVIDPNFQKKMIKKKSQPKSQPQVSKKRKNLN